MWPWWRRCVRQGKAARRTWWIRTARGQCERGRDVSRVRLDRSQKTPSNQLIQPGLIKHLLFKIRSSKFGKRAAPRRSGSTANPTQPGGSFRLRYKPRKQPADHLFAAALLDRRRPTNKKIT